MPSIQLSRRLGPAPAAMIVALLLAAAPAAAQRQSGMGQEDTGSNPTAQSVTESQLLNELDRVTGRVSIPDSKAGTLEQPRGRDFRAFHEGALPWIGAIVILGMIVLLALFYFIRGRIRTQMRAGIKIERFNWFERFNHWMTATAFIVLGLTGLNYFFGKRLLMPIIGPDLFASWSHWAKQAHNFIAWPFMLGIVLMLVMWIKDNIPDRYDLRWDQGRRRHGGRRASPGGALQCRAEAGILGGRAGRRGAFGLRAADAVFRSPSSV